MSKHLLPLILVLTAAAAIALAVSAGSSRPGSAGAPESASASTDPAARGSYLVHAMGCADCHTPWKMGANGPEQDMSRWLSGHQEEHVFPPAPKLPEGPWVATVSGTMTAWSGPWGTSFTANLTPDVETGLGAWTFEQFRDAIRSGRHQGRGRPILPPMPWFAIKNLTDEDLGNVFAYLQSLPPIRNRVPEPVPPAESH